MHQPLVVTVPDGHKRWAVQLVLHEIDVPLDCLLGHLDLFGGLPAVGETAPLDRAVNREDALGGAARVPERVDLAGFWWLPSSWVGIMIVVQGDTQQWSYTSLVGEAGINLSLS